MSFTENIHYQCQIFFMVMVNAKQNFASCFPGMFLSVLWEESG